MIDIRRRFIPVTGPTGRLPTNAAHLNFKWVEPGRGVMFSITRRGRAASCHFTADRAGMHRIHDAVDEFLQFVFYMFPWCDMVLALITLEKVVRIVRECGLEFVTHDGAKGVSVYMIHRDAYRGVKWAL